MQLIGKGLFSKVYKISDKQVLVKSICNAKECLSQSHHLLRGIFPKYNRLDRNEYTTEYYPRVISLKKALKPEDYAIYLQLTRLSAGICVPHNHRYSAWRQAFARVTNVKFRRALIEMIDEMANYGEDVSFEISPRNVAVKNGRLILLDVFYFAEQCLTQKSKKDSYDFIKD